MRLAGADRYGTNLEILKEAGVNFPDGLTGGSLAYALGAPLVLTRNKEADIRTAADYVKSSGADKFVVFGGESAVPSSVIASVAVK